MVLQGVTGIGVFGKAQPRIFRDLLLGDKELQSMESVKIDRVDGGWLVSVVSGRLAERLDEMQRSIAGLDSVLVTSRAVFTDWEALLAWLAEFFGEEVTG